MDSYQAVYDATRSRIGHFDGDGLQREIASRFDISYAVERVKDEFMSVAYEQMRPSVIYKPSVSVDGNQWCALYGKDLQSGVSGFGDSVSEAMDDFDKEWVKKLK